MDMTTGGYPHGGDIYDKQIKLDLSVNLNPMGIPENVRRAFAASADKTELYPDLKNRSLKQALSVYFDIDPECIAVGNGVSELIMAVFHALRPGKLITPAPEFYGILRAAGAAGCEINSVDIIRENHSILSGKELITELVNTIKDNSIAGFDRKPDTAGDHIRKDTGVCVMLTNPNNPTGLLTAKDDLLELAGICSDRGMLLGVDESFIPFTEGQDLNSVYKGVRQGSLFVMRSFTKLFAMPGIRLGVMLASPQLISAVEAHLPEWNISAAATEAGIAALKEKAYILRTPELIAGEREYLKAGLEKLGFRVYPSGAPYLFFYSEKDICEPLLKRGILIRDCSDIGGAGKGFYRTAVRNRAENEGFLKVLKELTE